MPRPADPAAPVPGAVPPRVAAWLADAPDGPLEVLHAAPRVLHLAVAGRAVGVLGPGVPGLPHAIRTSCVWMTTGRIPTPYLESGTLRLGARALVTGRLVDVRAPRLDAARVLQASPAAAQGTPRPRGAGLVACDDRLLFPVGGDLRPADAAALVGRGEGLTPWGDDVLCGWLGLHRALDVPTPAVDDAVRRALPRTTTLSATLLECALAGEVADPLGRHLRCLGTPQEDAARAALEALGHSSGRGLALGVDLALGSLAGRVAA